MDEEENGLMDNQHQQITGYRDLTQNEIDLMNRIKELGEEVGALVKSLSNDHNLDQRWINIGNTQLQQGFMALVRGVAKPTSF
jgi:hypothetical protein